jgi:hypothetical protein
MQFSSGTNSIVDDARYWSRSNSTTYAIADLVRNANTALDRVISLIFRADNTWEFDDANNTDLPIATTSLVSAQQDYSLAVTHLKVLRVRAKNTSGNWVTLDPVSRRDVSDSELASSGTPSKYDKLGNSIFLTPEPNYASSGGLEVQFQRGADYFTTADTTKSPGFASQFHRLISLYAALDHTDSRSMEKQSAKIRARIEPLEQELIEFYSSRDYDRAHSLSLRRDDYGGYELGAGGRSSDNPKGFDF